MNKFELKGLVTKTLAELNCNLNKIAIEVNGRLDYYTEREVKALQIIAMRKYRESPQAYKEFISQITIYTGRCKGKPKKKGYSTLTINPDGSLNGEFDKGFYDVNNILELELSKL
jgi:hypothetical protein